MSLQVAVAGAGAIGRRQAVPRVAVEDALRSLSVIEAVRRAIETGTMARPEAIGSTPDTA